VSIEFAPGEITGLIGPNGSGKSTLVNLVTGEVPAESGRIRLGDLNISGLRTRSIVRAGVARTYQVPLAPPELTVAELVGVPFAHRRTRSTPSALSSVDEVLEFCGLQTIAHVECRSLSTPELRRLGVARALACNPDVLLLDEVMASLPAHEAHLAVELVTRIRSLGITVIMIEHVMKIIANVCDSVVVLNQGRVLAMGAPNEVLARAEVREAYLGRRFRL
jgi:branched-chain amino acid transport system ATP-binding protein